MMKKLSLKLIKNTKLNTKKEIIDFLEKLNNSLSDLYDLRVNKELYEQIKDFKNNHYKCIFCNNYFKITVNKNKRSKCCDSLECIEKNKEYYKELILKRKITCLKKYNNANYINNEKRCKTLKKTLASKSPEFWINKKKKIEKTMIEKYGYKTNLINPEYKEKIKQTNLEKYSYENPFYSKEMQEQFKQTKLKKYGNYNNYEKIKQTNLEKYGVETPIQNTSIKNKILKTKLEKYGNYNNYEKIKQTNLEKYEVEHNFQILEIKEKIKQTNLEKYGTENIKHSHIKNYNEYNKEGLLNFIDSKGKLDIQGFADKHNIKKNHVYKLKSFWNINNPNKHYKLKKQFEFINKFKGHFNLDIQESKEITIKNQKFYPDGFFIAEKDILIKKNVDFTKVKTHIPFDSKDIFIPRNSRVILEFDGDYWHGFSNDDSSIMESTAKAEYAKTLERAKYLISNGYKVIKIWEYYYDNCSDFYNYIEDYENY